VYFDVKSYRIPNWLNASAMIGALAFHGLTAGFAGAGTALLGACAGFALLLLPHLGGFLGAGDVKAAMALGAWFGAPVLASLLVWASLLGGLCGFLILLLNRGLLETITRWAGSLTITFYTKRFTYLAPEVGSAATRVLPFACVLGSSVTAQFLWGTPWA
jgi:Flp pilus assembly protein protease CpaA